MFAALTRSIRQTCTVVSRTPMVYVQRSRPITVLSNNRLMSKKKEETDEEFDQRHVAYFQRADIDGWEIRKGMTDLHALDLVPEPAIVIEAIKACRRINDLALAIRILEAVKDKCSTHVKIIWPYMVQEIGPTCAELGVPLPEEIGYDKPELWKEPTSWD